MSPVMNPVGDYGTDVVLPRLLSQYRRAARLIGLLRTGCEGANRLEQALFEVRSGYWLRLAVGQQLDVLGKVYNFQRDGLSDDDYRTQLQFRAAMLVNGTPEEIVTFLSFVLGGTVPIEYQPEYPAGYALLGADVSIPSEVLNSLSPSGVEATFGLEMLDALGDPMQDANGASMYVART